MHMRSVIYGKIEERKLLKGDRMVTAWHWKVTEWSLKCTCHLVDWMVTERWLNGAFQFSRNGGVSFCDMSSLPLLLLLVRGDKIWQSFGRDCYNYVPRHFGCGLIKTKDLRTENRQNSDAFTSNAYMRNILSNAWNRTINN